MVGDSVSLYVVALGTVALLPRDDIPGGERPVGLVSWTLLSLLEPRNRIELNDKIEPRISVDWANDPYLEEKKEWMQWM